ncbi:unnamed protein product, partial [Polarella glacialis]
VMELGCGTGLVSIAALLGGARLVLATDLAWPNVSRAKASAQLNGVELLGEVFDVKCSDPLPSCDSKSPLAEKLPNVFDFLVFSDVLYWPAEAYAAGSTVIIADPGRRRDDFMGALREELVRRLAEVGEPLPSLEPQATHIPEHVYDWASAEVRTASSLFCKEPFELVLRRPQSAMPLGSGSLTSGSVGLPAAVVPSSFEVVD